MRLSALLNSLDENGEPTVYYIEVNGEYEKAYEYIEGATYYMVLEGNSGSGVASTGTIILTVTSADKMLGTILSRVKKIKLEPQEQSELKEYDKICEIVDNNFDTFELLKFSEYFSENKDEITDILSFMIKYCEKKISQSVLSGSQKNDIINNDKIIKIIESAEEALYRLKRNCNFNMVIDNLLISIADT